MAEVVRLAERRSAVGPDRDTRGSGEVIALRRLDLETVVELVQMLRTQPDQSLLDPYNRAQEPIRRSA